MVTINEIVNIVFIQPLSNLISSAIRLLPQILITALLLVITYLISHLVGVVVRKFLYRIKIDKLIRVKDLHDTFGATSLATIYGYLVEWLLFILFVGKIIEVVHISFIYNIANVLIFLLTKLVFVVVIIVTGLVIIDFFTLRLLKTKDKLINSIIKATRAISIVVLVFTSLEQFGIKLSVAENIFLMVVGATLFAISLALGIGFGLALKEEAGDILKRLKKKRAE